MILNPHPDYAEMTIKGIKPDLEIGDTLEIGDISYELVQKSSPNDSGYAGYAYRNKSTGDIIVVHEGSEDISNIQNILKNQDEVIKDWIKSDGAFVKNEIPPQFDDAKDFLNEVKSNNSNSNIIQIGQSLGGGLSQLLGMLDNNKNITTYTYNAPGCYRYKDILRQNGYNISANFNNITNYRSKNEPVSGIFKQAGNTYMAINGKSFNHDVRIQTDPSLIYVRNSQSYCYPYGIISSKPYSSGVISSAQPKLFISNFKEAQNEGDKPTDPIIFDLNNDGVLSTTNVENGKYFDHDNDGFAEASAWVGENDGILVVDSNNNSKIDNGTEVLLHSTLAAFDTNNDGIIDANDADFNNLKILKGDGTLLSLADAGIISINLNTSSKNITDENGNQQFASGTFTKSDGSTGTFGEFLVSTDTTNSMATDWLEETAA